MTQETDPSPPADRLVPLNVMVAPAMLAALDALTKADPAKPGRSAIVRGLISKGLAARSCP